MVSAFPSFFNPASRPDVKLQTVLEDNDIESTDQALPNKLHDYTRATHPPDVSRGSMIVTHSEYSKSPML